MDSRHNDIHDYCIEHFNEPVLDCFRLVRLIGYGETAVDAYYICQCREQGVYWSSAVGGVILLNRIKGQEYVKATNGEDWDDFYRCDKLLELNGVPKIDKFILDLRPDDHENNTSVQLGIGV